MDFFLEVVLLRNKLTPIPPKNVFIKYLTLPLATWYQPDMEQAWAWAHMLKSKLWLTFNVLRTWARQILKIEKLFKPKEFNYLLCKCCNYWKAQAQLRLRVKKQSSSLLQGSFHLRALNAAAIVVIIFFWQNLTRLNETGAKLTTSEQKPFSFVIKMEVAWPHRQLGSSLTYSVGVAVQISHSNCSRGNWGQLPASWHQGPWKLKLSYIGRWRPGLRVDG